MKTERLLIFFLLITTSLIITAQEHPGSFSLSVSMGYGNLGMKDLKRINAVTARSLPFDTKEFNCFEPAPFFAASLKYIISKQFYTAIVYHHYSTGSRIGQKDYSGYYSFDQFVKGNFAGIEPGIVFGNKHFSLSPSMPVGLMFSSLEMKEKIIVGVFENHDDIKVVAHSFIFIPSAKLTIPVTSFLCFTCGAGWMYDNGGSFHLKKEKKAKLSVEGPVSSGWQGWRLSCGITLTMPVKNTTVKEYRNSEYFEKAQ